MPDFDSAQFERVIDTLQAGLIVAHVRKARFPPIDTLKTPTPSCTIATIGAVRSRQFDRRIAGIGGRPFTLLMEIFP